MKGSVRLGIIGVSAMGGYHAAYIREGKVNRCELTAVCDTAPAALEKFSDIKTFTNSADLIRSGEVDALLIATPHYSHTTIGIDALENGLHVLMEKPLSVHKADCLRLLSAHTNDKQMFAVMLNVRTDLRFMQIKKLLDDGVLGDIIRISWTITDWFRPDAYYASAAWRGTWKGEGGGVLINQCPHQFDLWQWMFGMPVSIRAFCKFGARHDIEVEDQVTAYFEQSNGASGVFTTSTGECPGTNRLEIAGDLGKLVFEDGKITLTLNEVSSLEFSRTTNQGFGRPSSKTMEVPVSGTGGEHEIITQNFVDAILDGTPLITPATEGIKAVEIANAMLYSTLTGSTIELPLDAEAFEMELSRLVATSKYEAKAVRESVMNVGSSFTGRRKS